jgi:hypothetical protein
MSLIALLLGIRLPSGRRAGTVALTTANDVRAGTITAYFVDNGRLATFRNDKSNQRMVKIMHDNVLYHSLFSRLLNLL